MTPTKAACLGATLLLAAMLARAALADPCPDKQPPYPPQSPRNINPHSSPGVYNGNRDTLFAVQTRADEVIYKEKTLLYLCDQHFHLPVENPQCAGETPPPPGCSHELDVLDPNRPRPGQWIEVHTVYAGSDSSACRRRLGLDNNLQCCLDAASAAPGTPVAVRAFSAKVTAATGNVPGGVDRPLFLLASRSYAEWSGSNTGTDKPPGSCKEVPVQWTFLLDRDLTVGEKQLFTRVHGARGVQSDDRLSRDLTLVGVGAGCKWVPAGEIRNDEAARATCPGLCKYPTPLWCGRWYNTWKPTDPRQASNCACCPLSPDGKSGGCSN